MNRGVEGTAGGHEVDYYSDSSSSSYGNDFEDDLEFCRSSARPFWHGEEEEFEEASATRFNSASTFGSYEGCLMNDTFKWNKNSFARPTTSGATTFHNPSHFYEFNRFSTNFANSSSEENIYIDASTGDLSWVSTSLVTSCKMEKNDNEVKQNIEQILEKFREKQILPEDVIKCLAVQWGIAIQPYNLILYLMEATQTLNFGQRTRFLNLILKSAKNWKSGNSGNQVQDGKMGPMPAPTANIKMEVFNLYVDSPTSIDIFTLENVFELGDSKDKNDYDGPIKKLLDKHDYVKASRSISALDLYTNYKCEEICLKLTCQGHIAELERFLDGHPKTQVEFIQTLDSFLSEEKKIFKFSESHKIPRVKMYQLNQNSLFRLGLRLVRKHKLNENICPNIAFMQASKAIRYLIIKRFILNEMACKEWEELVDVAVASNPKLQLYLVNELGDRYEEQEAAVMAAKYKVPENKLSKKIVEKLKYYLRENENKVVVCPEIQFTMMNEDKDKYHGLSLPKSNLQFVDKKLLLNKAVETIKKEAQFIGFDSEWRPTFTNVVQRSKLSLIQIATEKFVFIVDVQTLLGILKEDEWNEFFKKIFCDPNILVVGYSLKDDMNMLGSTFPFLKPLMEEFNLFDLENIHHKLQEQSFMIDGWIMDVRGLSDLVKRCLGKPLDKSQQISDWGKRPLRQQQLTYAALDAYCLVEIYNFFVNNNYSMVVNAMTESRLTIPKYNLSRRKESRTNRKTRDLDIRNKHLIATTKKNKKLVSQVRFICDSTLTTLGKHLRMCGIDTILLEEEEDYSHVIEASRKENRIILSSGIPYEFFKNQIKNGMYYGVRGTNIHEQLLDIFENFNIRIRHDDIFSRCQACNCSDYLVLSSMKMKTLWERKRDMLGMTALKQELTEYSINIHRFPKFRSLKDDLKNKSDSAIKLLDDIGIDIRNSATGIGLKQDMESFGPREELEDLEDEVTYDDEDEDEDFSDHDDISIRPEASLKMINLESITLIDKNIPIQCEWLPSEVFDHMAQFFICLRCGKVSWEEPFREKEGKFAFLMGKAK